MTGVVLALAGLAAGDGGPGIGAAAWAPATEPLPRTFQFRGEWEGVLMNTGDTDPDPVEVRWDGRTLHMKRGGQERSSIPLRIVVEGEGLVRLIQTQRHQLPALARRERGSVVIGFHRATRRPQSFDPSDSATLLILKPAAPHKR
jgi:hypothetical protein